MIWLLLGVGAALYMFSRPAALGSPGSNSKRVLGAVSEQIYPVGFGPPGADGRRVFSVFDPEDNTLLFTFTATDAGELRSLLARNPDAQTSHVELGIRDFGFL